MNKMHVNYAFPLLLVLTVLFASCSKRYKIDGKSSVTGLDGKMLYLKTLQDGDWVAIDSAEVVHGLFQMKGSADSVRVVTLYMGDEGLMPLVLEDGKILVNITNVEMKAEGTPLSVFLLYRDKAAHYVYSTTSPYKCKNKSLFNSDIF